MSRILKSEKLPDSDLKILEQERSRSLKKWLLPPLVLIRAQLLSAHLW